MTHVGNPAAASSEYPLATLLRAADRQRLLVQLMASVWDTALGLAVLRRESHEVLDGNARNLPALWGR